MVPGCEDVGGKCENEDEDGLCDGRVVCGSVVVCDGEEEVWGSDVVAEEEVGPEEVS